MSAGTPPNEAQAAANDDDVSLVDLLLVLANHARLLIIAPMVAGLAALGISFLMKPVYTASAQIMVPQTQSAASALLGSLGGLAGAVAGGGLSGLKNPADQWVSLLKSRTVADALIAKYDLRTVYESEFRFQAADALAARTNISAGKDGLIEITVDDHEPKRAAAIAQSYIDELQNLSRTMAIGEAAQRRVFFERQLREAKANLVKAETALKESGLNPSVLKTSPEATVGALAQLQAQVTTQEVAVSVMRKTLTSNSPDLQRELAQLASLRSQLQRSERTDRGAGDASGADYIAKYRDFKYYETLFEMMARQYELARVDEARDGAFIQVVDGPLVPEYKSKPQRGKVAILTAVATLLLCVVSILIAQGISSYGARPDGAEKLAKLKRTFGLRRSA